MADPRFYDNHGPFTLAEVCARVGASLPDGANGEARIADIASLSGAAPEHLSFFTGTGLVEEFAQSRAGFCLVPKAGFKGEKPSGMTIISVSSPQHALVAAIEMFYPRSSAPVWAQKEAISPSAQIGEGVVLGPGVVIGPHAEIGKGTCIGPNTVIGRGVAIGRDCEIGSNVGITHAYIGDEVVILSGAQIGESGFGFASDKNGHRKIPQIGRVIIQDRVEIGACTAIDRGALGDTVIGEGTKIDNLVQIGHNTHIGRHCVIAGHAGISGSCDVGDFVMMGGQVGLSDHVFVGDGARFIARSGVIGKYAGGQDYGGMPAIPVRDWMRQVATVKALAARKRKSE